MSSRSGTSREDERRLNLRTLVIASISSAVAAIVVSRFWRSGTPIAAAMTPVIVTLVSEMLHRPTTVIAQRLTTDFSALPDDGSRIEPADPHEDIRRDPQAEREARLASMGGGSPARAPRPRTAAPRRQLPVRLILVTGLLAFAIAAAALTLPELIAGQSFGRGNTHTTLFGGNKHKSGDSKPTQDTTTGDSPDQQQQQPDQQQTTPQTTTPAPQQTTPQTTTPAPTTTAPSTKQQPTP
jgi:uncharacterized membrane protein YvlD (DUF360 family)